LQACQYKKQCGLEACPVPLEHMPALPELSCTAAAAAAAADTTGTHMHQLLPSSQSPTDSQ
jgi:hypothetical protein